MSEPAAPGGGEPSHRQGRPRGDGGGGTEPPARNIVGVRLRPGGRSFCCDAGTLLPRVGTRVVIQAEHGPEDAEGGGEMIVGVSPAIRRALVLAERYARTRLPILLVGATGTGKELFAQHIHERSGRPGPLVDVNCCALPRDMVESLLF